MSRRPVTFRKIDVRRAVQAAASTGRSIAGVEVRPDGSVFVRYGEPLAAVAVGGDEGLEAVIAEYQSHGKGRHVD